MTKPTVAQLQALMDSDGEAVSDTELSRLTRNAAISTSLKGHPAQAAHKKAQWSDLEWAAMNAQRISESRMKPESRAKSAKALSARWKAPEGKMRTAMRARSERAYAHLEDAFWKALKKPVLHSNGNMNLTATTTKYGLDYGQFRQWIKRAGHAPLTAHLTMKDGRGR